MSHPHRYRPISTICALAIALTSASVHADIVLEERMRVEGSGLMRMINMTASTVTKISGDRSRTDSELQMDSRLVRMFAGSGPTAEIVRLDEGTIYQLDVKNKTYTQTTLAEQRAEMERAIDEMREAQQGQQQGTSGIDESQCEWSPPVTASERTGEMAQFAGYEAERMTFTATQSCVDRSADQVCDFRLTLDQWVATDFDAADETMEYYQAYAEALGLGTPGSRDFAQRVESLFGGYEGLWSGIAEHMVEIEGYAVKSSIGLAVGGLQCSSMQQAQAAAPGVGEAVGGAIGGALGGLLGRQRDSSRRSAAPSEATGPADGMMSLMTIHNELVSVSRAPLDPEVFEVPGDFSPAR